MQYFIGEQLTESFVVTFNWFIIKGRVAERIKIVVTAMAAHLVIHEQSVIQR